MTYSHPGREGMRAPTIQDVAARAGVSVATVSRTMNGSAKVREATSVTVRAAIAELGYSPSWLARDLRQQKSGRILVLFPSLHSPVMAEVFRGMDEVAQENDYYCLICPTAKDAARERQLVELLLNRVVDGIIFFGTTLPGPELEKLAQKHPVIQCAEWEEAPSAGRVSIDDFAGARDLTAHLIAGGHKRIAMISNRSEYSGRLREEGFRSSMTGAGLDVHESMVLDGDYEFGTGRALTRQLLDMPNPPTAIFCISDVVAAGAIAEANARGAAIPSDIAIAGFDDSREATMSLPMITTVRQPFGLIGRRAMEMMLTNVAGPRGGPGPVEVLPHELVVRASTVNSKWVSAPQAGR